MTRKNPKRKSKAKVIVTGTNGWILINALIDTWVTAMVSSTLQQVFRCLTSMQMSSNWSGLWLLKLKDSERSTKWLESMGKSSSRSREVTMISCAFPISLRSAGLDLFSRPCRQKSLLLQPQPWVWRSTRKWSKISTPSVITCFRDCSEACRNSTSY